jgi:phosphoenolpyruvate-protein kinase (PTS system EI component)
VIGRARQWGVAPVAGAAGGAAEAVAALAQVAAELGAEAARLRSRGEDAQADILETSQLMAEDPSLLDEVGALAGAQGAAGAIAAATERQTALLAALPDERLAARAEDVRAIGRRAVALLSARGAAPRPGGAPSPYPLSEGEERPAAGLGEDEGRVSSDRTWVILVALNLGPADVSGLDLAGGAIAGIVLAGGSPGAHAAIMARANGVPMVVGVGEDALTISDGALVVLDGDGGSVTVDPSAETLTRAEERLAAQKAQRDARKAARDEPAQTRDGHAVKLLCNAASAAEVVAGLAAGAEGVGLYRTELAFLEAQAWPSEEEHLAALDPALAPLVGRIATVRSVDFGGDKTPPFLRGTELRGVALQLRSPEALAAQMRAIVRAGRHAELRIKLPLVETREQLLAVRSVLAAALAAIGGHGAVELGASVETRAGVDRIDEIVAAADFLSIGTNDLTHDVLGADRVDGGVVAALAADPRVLGAIGRIVAAAHSQGRTVEVCGEAAGEPAVVPLLIGLGVDELSVAPSRVDEVRQIVRSTSFAEARGTADALLGR